MEFCIIDISAISPRRIVLFIENSNYFCFLYVKITFFASSYRETLKLGLFVGLHFSKHYCLFVSYSFMIILTDSDCASYIDNRHCLKPTQRLCNCRSLQT